MEWNLSNIIKDIKKELSITEKSIKKYIKESIFKSYLIHVEFEVLNILTQIKLNKLFRNIYQLSGLNINIIENKINDFLDTIKKLIEILEF